MNKHIFLTSILAITIAGPAYATIESGSTCNATNLGQSDNNSTANVEAIWNANTYSENPGYYLLFSNGTISQNQECPAGSYCTGFTNQSFNDASMGIASCPTGYTQSEPGTDTQDSCYNTSTRNCSIKNPYSGVNANQVTSVTYGNSNNGFASCKNYYGDPSEPCRSNGNECGITAITCNTGYTAVSSPNPLASINWSSMEIGGFINDSSSGSPESPNADILGLTESQTVADKFSSGILRGRVICSETNGNNISMPNENVAGQYCWYKTTGFTPNGESEIATKSSWVYLYDFPASDLNSGTTECAIYCARIAMDLVGYAPYVQNEVISSQQIVQCIANTINIDWDPKNGEQHTTNQCTYNDTITLPTQPSKTGYTFGGWTLKQASQVSE